MRHGSGRRQEECDDVSQSEPTRDGDSQEYSGNCEREEFTTKTFISIITGVADRC